MFSACSAGHTVFALHVPHELLMPHGQRVEDVLERDCRADGARHRFLRRDAAAMIILDFRAGVVLLRARGDGEVPELGPGSKWDQTITRVAQ